MAIFNVKVYAVDWCGYEDYTKVEAKDEDEAIDKAVEEFISFYDLIMTDTGEYVDADSLDEDGNSEEDGTTIAANIVEDDE